jgi:hypothetical protein
MCDVESTIYLPLLEETGYMPTEKYAPATEIFGYCQLLGRHFDLYPMPCSRPRSSRHLGRRRAPLAGHDPPRRPDLGQFFVTAGGILHKAKLPGIEGIDDFAGKAFHTTRWDYGYTGGSPTEPMDQLADKVVGIIGTGATAIQIVPQLARAAKEVYVFQRTPSAVGVRANAPIDPEWFPALQPGWQRERILNFTEAVTGQARVDLVADGWDQVPVGSTPSRRPADDPRSRPSSSASTSRSWRGFRRPHRRGRRGPRDRREAEALVRQALQADLLPRRVPAVVQPAERPPRRHRRRGVREMSSGPVVDGRSTRSTCWCSRRASR